MLLWGINHVFTWLSPCMRQVAHTLLTRPPLRPWPKSQSPLDLHVLSTPPAFILSQNQTLVFISCASLHQLVSFVAFFKLLSFDLGLVYSTVQFSRIGQAVFVQPFFCLSKVYVIITEYQCQLFFIFYLQLNRQNLKFKAVWFTQSRILIIHIKRALST